jgi:hypothetical protein
MLGSAGSCSQNRLGADLLRMPIWSVSRLRRSGVVDTLLFLVEVAGPVIFEVAVADQCAEFEDGF